MLYVGLWNPKLEVELDTKLKQIENSLAGHQVGAGLAGAGVRRAAHIASVPFRAAQRNYLPIGQQLYLFPHAVATSMRGARLSLTLNPRTCPLASSSACPRTRCGHVHAGCAPVPVPAN